MNKQLIILPCLLVLSAAQNCFSSDVLNPKKDKSTEEVEATMKKRINKNQGNFLVVRNLEAAVISTRSLVAKMNTIQRNVMFDDSDRNKALDDLTEMMKESFEMKVRFEDTVGEIMGRMTTIETSVNAVAMCAAPGAGGSNCRRKAKDMLSLSDVDAKFKTLKRMLDNEVNSAADQFGQILQSFSGAEVFQHLKKEIENLDTKIRTEEQNVEKLSKDFIKVQMDEVENEGAIKESKQMLAWLKNQERKQEKEAEWDKAMQTWKMVRDSIPQVSYMGVSAKMGDAEIPERPAAEILKANELKDGLAKYHKQQTSAEAKRKIFPKQKRDAEAKYRKGLAKLEDFENKRRQKISDMDKALKKVNAVSEEHATIMLDAVTSFFHQKKNLIALSTSIAMFSQFISGWHEHWSNYDSMNKKTKELYIECLTDMPMGWGTIAPEMWSSVQVFPGLLKKLAADGLAEIATDDDASSVKTFRDSVKEMWEANKAMQDTLKTDL